MSDGARINVVLIGEDQLSAILNGAVVSINQFGDAAGQGGPKLSAFEQMTVGALRNIGAAAVDMAARGIQAIGSFGADSIKVAGDFEAGMNQFSAAAGDSLAAAGLSVNDFRDQFLQLGADLPVSTMEVQNAAIALIKGGLDPATVAAGGLEASLKFAGAAEMGLADAAELGVKILGTFGDANASAAEQASFLANAQDLMTKAANASVVDVDKLGDAMLAAAGAAKGAGVDYGDFTTTMGAIAKGFGSAAEEGTSYKNFLTRLNPTTSSARDAMNQLGLMTTSTGNIMRFLGEHGIKPLGTDLDALGNQFTEYATSMGWTTKEIDKFWTENFQTSKFFDEQTGAFVGNRESAELLKNALAGLSDQQRSTALSAIFGNDASGAAIALANLGAAGYDDFAASMAAANGVAQQYAATQQGLGNAWQNFTGSVEALQIVIGSAFLPILTALLNNVLTPGVNTIRQFAQAMLGSAAAFAALPPVLQSVVSFFELLWNAEGALEAAFISAGTYSLAFGMALDQLGAALGLPVGMLSGISFAVQGFIAMVYPAADAVGAFVLGLGDLGTVSTTLTALFGTTIGGLITQAIAVLNNYAQVWIDLGTTVFNVVAALLSGDLAGAWSALTSGLAQVVLDYQTYALSFGQLIGSIAQTILTAILAYAPLIAAQVLTWGTAFVDWITPYAALALTTLSTWLAGLWAWIQLQAPGWLITLGAWGMALVNWATPYLGLALTTLSGWLAGAWAWVQQQAPGWLAQLGAWGSALAEWIGPAIPPALAALAGLGTSVLSWVGTQAAPLLASFSAWATSLVEWIPGATVSFLAAWPGMLSSFLDWIASAAGPLLAQLGMWALQFLGWIIPMIPSFLVALGGIAVALGVFIVETVAVLVAKLWQWKQAFVTWMAEVSPMLRPALAQFVTNIKDWIVSAAKALGDAALSIGSSLVDGIRSGIERAWGKLTSWISAQVAKIPAPIRQALGIHSPSRVMAELVGQPIAQGIGAGFAQSFPAVQTKLLSSMADLASKAVKATQDGIAAIQAAASYSGPGGSGLSGFLAGFAELVAGLDAAATTIGPQMLASATKFAESLGKIAGAVKPGVEALQALDGFAAPAQWAVDAFAQSLVGTVARLAEAAAAFDAGAIAGAVVFAESVGKVLALIQPAVTAIQALEGYSKPAAGSVQQFTNTVYWLATRFMAAGAGMDGDALGGAVTFAGAARAIVELIAPAIDGLVALESFARPAAGSVQQFTNTMYWLVSRFVLAGQGMRGPGLTSAMAFADGAGKILALIQPAVDGFAALESFARPAAGSVQQFTNTIYWLVSRFVEAGQGIRGPALSAAVAFTDGAGKVVALIKPAVEGFAVLPDLVAPTWDSSKAFADALLKLIGMLWFTVHMLDADGVQASATFAEAAGKIVGLIKPAIEGFAVLPDLVAPTWDSTKAFADALLKLIGMLWFTVHTLDADGVAASATFAESAGKIVAIIKPAIEGFAVLPDLVAPTWDSSKAFADALLKLIGQLWFTVHTLDAEAVAAAAKFAESAGKVVGILKNGVDGLNALGDLHQASDAAIQSFVAMVNRLMVDLGAAAGQFSADAIAAAGKFAEAAGKAVGILKNGVDGLLAVSTFTGTSEAAITRFADSVRLAVAAMARLASEFGADATAAAKAFAQAAGESTDFLKKGVDGFKKLSEIESVPTAGLKLFEGAIILLIQTMIRLAGVISTQMLADATRIANATDSVITVLKDAIKALITLGDATTLIPDTIGKFVSAVTGLATQFSKALIPPAGDVGGQVVTAIAGGMLAAIPGALTKLASLQAQLLTALAAIRVALAGPSLTIGQQIALGIAQGIGAGTPAIVSAVYAAVNAALAAARAALGIASPSKVFDQVIGQQAGAGLAQGLDRSIPTVAAASARLADATIAPTQAGIAPGAAQPVSTSTSRSVTLQVAPGAIVIHARDGESGPATADRGLDRLQQLVRMASPG